MKANFDLPQVRSLITRPPLPSHFVMARRVIRMPRIVCTGYEVTGALRRYLEVGLGLNIGGNLFINVDDDDVDEESDDDDDFVKPIVTKKEESTSDSVPKPTTKKPKAVTKKEDSDIEMESLDTAQGSSTPKRKRYVK